MSAIFNPRDILMQGAPARLLPITLPPNLVIPGLDQLAPDPAAPPVPSGFSVVGSVTYLNFRTNAPAFTQGHGHARTTIYAARWTEGQPLPVFADAVKITSFTGQVASHPTLPATTWHCWATWVSRDGGESAPAGGLNGQVASTSADVERLVAAMTGPGNPFVIVPTATTLSDGTVVPAGTYTSNAYMSRFVAARGQIGLLAVDDARIASASATKLITGTVQVGVNISSSNYVSGSQGWAINGQGGAEFSGVTVRGTIVANAGSIGGNTINAAGIYSPNFVNGVSGWGMDNAGNAQFNSIAIRGALMGGGFTGYAWPPNGATGFYLGPAGLLLGNPLTGRYFQVAEDGNMYAPGMSIVNGALTINQLNVINTANIAGNAVSQMANASGVSSVSCNLYIPANQTMRIVAFASSFEQYANVGVTANSLALYIDGVLVSSGSSNVTATPQGSGDGSTVYIYQTAGLTIMGAAAPNGGGGRSVTITSVGPRDISLVAFGALR